VGSSSVCCFTNPEASVKVSSWIASIVGSVIVLFVYLLRMPARVA
jgi:uncharacterized membrane protein YeaQ/YmgE (transglycosylase-associated protein family)